MSIVSSTERIPWLLPQRSPLMAQTWHDLLFVHWPVPAEVLLPSLPPGVQLDLFEGQAWLGIVAFRLTGVRLLAFPELPFVSYFPEVNVRTYVRVGDRPGVYFLSLDTDNRPAVALARAWFRLLYHHAHMEMKSCGSRISLKSRRDEHKSPPAEFEVTYSPYAPPHIASPCSLDCWLTERYRYYSTDRNGRLCHCDIHHTVWPLQPAEAYIRRNTMALCHGITLPAGEPLLHYARRMQALIWPVELERSICAVA
ncbi:MAG: DUF2071 domain-containing protein [Chloroflexota bacterium]|nr:DUF2071 domain-containing protein [Chloroflexota bacterium]